MRASAVQHLRHLSAILTTPIVSRKVVTTLDANLLLVRDDPDFESVAAGNMPSALRQRFFLAAYDDFCGDLNSSLPHN